MVSPLFVIGGVRDVAALLVAAGVVPSAGLLALDWWLRYGGVEYRIADDAVVTHDRLFRTRLRRVEPWDESDLRVERDRLDRRLGTSSVVVERSDGPLLLPHLREPEAVFDVFDRAAADRETGAGAVGREQAC
jgi:hypothetical protein